MIENSNTNPLQKYYRQPAIYIKLPTEGRYYTKDVYTPTETGEIPVLPMTAKDELAFKTPDALLNGEATVTVIQSCVPAIKNAWSMPSIDVDAVLIAIRMATYGDKMSVPVTIPNTKIQRDFELDLQSSLDKLLSAQYQETVFVADMEVKTNPLNYNQFTKMAIKSFEEARLQETIRNQDIPEEDKLKRFQQSLTKLTALNVGMVTETVVSVKVDGQTVTDKAMIAEFIENAEAIEG